VWGIEIAPLYASMDAIGRLPDGATVLDVPCGGGVALRAVPSSRRLRYVAVDVEQRMLDRCAERGRARGVEGLELLRADMRALPLPDGLADLCLSYSGLHMVSDPDVALAEAVRCLKPGGELIGTTFVAQGSRRQRLLLGQGPAAGELRSWLEDAGVESVVVEPERGFALFRGRKRTDLQ
jgi:ubiquinone/menaquinone biosynthesis C-methylase UbiE